MTKYVGLLHTNVFNTLYYFNWGTWEVYGYFDLYRDMRKHCPKSRTMGLYPWTRKLLCRLRPSSFQWKGSGKRGLRRVFSSETGKRLYLVLWK